MKPILPSKPLWATALLGLGLAISTPAAAQARLAIIPSHSFDSRALAEGWAFALGGELRRAGAQVTPSSAVRADLVWPPPPGDPPASALGVFAVSHGLQWIAALEPSDGPHSGMVRVRLERPSDGAIKSSRSFPLTSAGAHAAALGLADLLELSAPQEGPNLSQDVLSRLGQAPLDPTQEEVVLAALESPRAGTSVEASTGAAELLAADLTDAAGADKILADRVAAILHRQLPTNDPLSAFAALDATGLPKDATAQGLLDKLVAQYPQSAMVAELQASAASSRGDVAATRDAFARAAAAAPEAAWLFSAACARLPSTAEGGRSCERVVELRAASRDPQLVEDIRNASALTMNLAGAFDPSLGALDINVDPAGNPEAAAARSLIRAKMNRARGDLVSARGELSRLPPRFAGAAPVLAERAREALASGEWLAAERLAAGVRDPHLRWEVAQANPARREALELFLPLWTSSTPTRRDVGVAYGAALLSANQMSEAQSVFRVLTTGWPDDPEVLALSSDLQQRTGHPEQAAISRRRALHFGGPGKAGSHMELDGAKVLLAGLPLMTEGPLGTPLRTAALIWDTREPLPKGIEDAVREGLSAVLELRPTAGAAPPFAEPGHPSAKELEAAARSLSVDEVLEATATDVAAGAQPQARIHLAVGGPNIATWESTGRIAENGGAPIVEPSRSTARVPDLPWILIVSGAAGLLALALLLRRLFRHRAEVRVRIMLDDAVDGRFCAALTRDSSPSLVIAVSGILLKPSDTRALSSDLERVRSSVNLAGWQLADGVTAVAFHRVPPGAYRLMVFGFSAPRSRLSLAPGGSVLRVAGESGTPHVFERQLMVGSRDIDVPFDFRVSALPRRPIEAPARPLTPPSFGAAEAAPPGRPSSNPVYRPGGSVPVPSGASYRTDASSLTSGALGGGPTGRPSSNPGGASPTANAPGFSLSGIAPPQALVGGQAQQKGRRAFLDGNYEEAAVLFHQAGDWQNESRCYLFLGQSEMAAKVEAEAALRAGSVELALELFRNAKDREGMVTCLRRLGREAEVLSLKAEGPLASGKVVAMAEKLLREGERARAAALFEEAGDPARALKLYEEAGEWGMVGRIHLAQGRADQACEVFIRAGMHTQAAEVWRSKGDMVRALACLEAGNLPAASAELLHQMGRVDEALRRALSVQADDPRLPQALLVQARISLERKDLAAIRQLPQRLEASPPQTSMLEATYQIGDLLQRIDAVSEALRVFRVISSVDPSFRDVRARSELLKSEVDQMAASTGGSLGSTQSRLNPGATQAGPGAQPLADSSSPTRPPSAAPVGEDRYRLGAELGRGAMGIVYRGEDTLLGRPLAIKVLPPALTSNAEATQMFFAEARALAALNHPHIVQIYDAGKLKQSLFLAMEFVEGETLERILARVPTLPLPTALGVADQVAMALDYAHRAGLVHRDVKPANVMVTPGGSVKLMDFGIAYAMSRADAKAGLGTPLYMAPEQALGRAVDGRTDLYALGVMLFRMTTGRLPFESGDVAGQHARTPPPSPRSLAPTLPEAAEALILRLLAKDPAQRFATAGELRAELARVHQLTSVKASA